MSEERRKEAAENLTQENRRLWVEVHSLTASERDLRRQLSEIEGSRVWRLAQVYWRLLRRARAALGVLWSLPPLVPAPAAPRWWRRRARRRRLQAADGLYTAELDVGQNGAGYDVIVLPVIDWHFRFQRPQQMASRFAGAGHRVFYARCTFRPDARVLGPALRERVWEVQLPAPAYLGVYSDRMSEGLIDDWIRALDRLRRASRIHSAVTVVQIPFWGRLAREMRRRWGWKVIYDCMDDLSGFGDHSWLVLRQEKELIETCDLALATSTTLQDRVSAAPRSLLLRNGTDYNHFHKVASVGVERLGGGVVIGYYGAIAGWFDVGAVAGAARARPDWRFVLIGRTDGARVAPLEELSNVELLGERPYRELPEHLARFNVCLIPFEVNDLTLATNPVKFYEYLSAGKPVVATTLPELEPFRDLHYPVEPGDHWVPHIEAALAETGERAEKLRRRRFEVARQNTWQARYERLDAEIADLHGAVAIVIVSYRNQEYLRQCLDSLSQQTFHPRWRVVVVDNGSGPEMEAFLRRCEAEHDWLTVVLTGENLGFPRANNVGIEAAGECDYVCLLNDDTVVTRGWLGRLLRHLEETPGAELAGPVSNWCGNEARIEVPYEDRDDAGMGTDLDEMHRFARGRWLRHEGESFDVPVLAMYCVVMRRDLLDRIGPLDERFGIGMFEDDDFARRVREAEGRLVCAEDVFIHHWGRSSFAKLDETAYEKLFNENRRKYEEKWGEPWQPHRARNA